jgi:hypothetical protein
MTAVSSHSSGAAARFHLAAEGHTKRENPNQGTNKKLLLTTKKTNIWG